MHDVQLLVVDRENPQRICGVREQGEIYVRASGLAEGYLGLESLTGEKFIPSWFVENNEWVRKDAAEQKLSGKEISWREFYKGPRDRLYRSGDLGHYDENGDVECTGRADNQVKIRGFRIELGEIDSHLSQHPVVRENVTLVRRDKDEEHILVSYIVPELSVWPQWLERKGLSDKPEDKSMSGMLNRFAGLRDDLRTYLGTKLPTYAVPNIIIPLNRMPLNPNGKVDRPALPFPNPEELNAALPRRSSIDATARSDTETSLAEIWGRILQIPSKKIGPDDSFFDLGAHSLSAQRMLFELRKRYSGLDVLIQSIYEYPKLREFSAEVDRALDPRGRMLDFESEVALHQEEHYSLDAKDLAQRLSNKFDAQRLDYSKPFTVFLTGATGFLGAYTLANLLDRSEPLVTVVAHVRAKSVEEGHSRLRRTCVAYGIWSESWDPRLQVVIGNLEEDRLGIAAEKWKELQHSVDVIIANGARV